MNSENLQLKNEPPTYYGFYFLYFYSPNVSAQRASKRSTKYEKSGYSIIIYIFIAHVHFNGTKKSDSIALTQLLRLGTSTSLKASQIHAARRKHRIATRLTCIRQNTILDPYTCDVYTIKYNIGSLHVWRAYDEIQHRIPIRVTCIR